MSILENKIIQRQIFVSGRVQGVFFRENCMREASQLKLSGGVRNLRDGRVEVQVSGVETGVNKLIKWLKTGPKHAKVSIIEVIDMAITDMNTKGMNKKDLAADNLDNRLNEALAGQFVVWPTK